MVLESVAEKVVSNYKLGDKEAAFDPSMIFTIIDIITSLIGNFKNCKKAPAEALKAAKSPTFWEKQVARRAVRQHLGGFKAMRREGENLLEAVIKTGGDLSIKEVEGLYAEVDE